MLRYLILLEIDKHIGYESESLVFHQFVHVLLANFDACEIDVIHLQFVLLLIYIQ